VIGGNLGVGWESWSDQGNMGLFFFGVGAFLRRFEGILRSQRHTSLIGYYSIVLSLKSSAEM
jgi:hypothetical protein